MNIITDPTARRISGQKIVLSTRIWVEPHEQDAGTGGHQRTGGDHQARIVLREGTVRRRSS